jgi:hypothetical protein
LGLSAILSTIKIDNNSGMKKRFKDLLLVTGSGRNVGKTTFICNVISSNPLRKMSAIKISPHFHEPSESLKLIVENSNFRIFEETDYTSNKDTSRYLRAGAEKSYFIQTDDASLKESFQLTSVLLDPDQPFLVESARLGQILVPELFLFIQGSDSIEKPFSIEMRQLADATVFSDGNEFSLNPGYVYFNNSWKIEEHDYA